MRIEILRDAHMDIHEEEGTEHEGWRIAVWRFSSPPSGLLIGARNACPHRQETAQAMGVLRRGGGP